MWTNGKHLGWNCLRRRVDDLLVTVVPDLGGRILSLAFQGQELLFGPLGPLGLVEETSSYLPVDEAKQERGFRLWGGSKTWVAPQRDWVGGVPPLTLDSGPYTAEVLGDAVVMQSDRCPETGLVVTRVVTLAAPESGLSPQIVLDQTFTNCGEDMRVCGIWEVTQFLRPCVVSFAGPVSSVHPVPDEGSSVEVFPEVVRPAKKVTRIECERPVCFKVCGAPDAGILGVELMAGMTKIYHERRFQIGNDYAHGGAIEVYNSADHPYCEVEVHSPMAHLAPGQSISHRQQWIFQPFSSGHAQYWDRMFDRDPLSAG